jgi:hypothetical protein
MISTKPWNRSSALTPAQLAVVTETTNTALRTAIRRFESALGDLNLSDEQRAYACEHFIPLIANGVTEGLAKAVDSLKK